MVNKKKDLEVMVRCFVELCRKKGLEVNAVYSKVMVVVGEEV